MNESFASWTIMSLIASFSSPSQWHKVVFVNLASLLTYCFMVFRHYGGVGNDYFVHVPTTFLLAAQLIRMNELNMRNSFNLLHESKQNEKKWLRVLTMLTDGVLVMQHTEADEGILLINDSLKQLLKFDHEASKSGNSVNNKQQKQEQKRNKASSTGKSKRFNLRSVGPLFDGLFSHIKFKVVYQH